MSCSRCTFLAFCFFLAACQRFTTPAPPGVNAVAILPFENQTGDPKLDWLTPGVQQVLLAQLSGVQLPLTGPADRQSAIQSNANIVWHGSFVPARPGRVRLQLSRENRATGHVSSEPPVDLPLDGGFFNGVAGVARLIGGGVALKPYPTAQVEALKEYVAGRTGNDVPTALAHYQRATELDPKYSSAWLNRAELTAALDQKAEAERLLEEFRTRVPDSPEIEQAQAAIVSARIKGDSVASALALKRLAAASPWNKAVQTAAGDTFSRLRWAPDAAAAFTRLTKIEPALGDHWNKLAYARANAGDLPGARQAIDEYRRLEPAELNVIDSLAEIEYRFGNFARAAQLFAELHQKGPGFNQGAALGKAAYAKLMSGDVAGADALFQRLLAHRQLVDKPGGQLLKADWLFQTGRRREALTQIKPPPGSTPVVRSAFQTEECLMHASAGAWEKAREASRQALTDAPPTGRALACAFLSQPEALAEEWIRRADRQFPAPAQRPLRNTALGYALALRGHCSAAMPTLRAVLDTTDPGADAEPITLLAFCAAQNKQWDVIKSLFLQWPVPPTQEPLFTTLVFPLQVAVRAKVEEHFEREAPLQAARKLYESLTAEGR